MAVTGVWTKKMTGAGDSVQGHVDYIRWISKAATAGDDCVVTIGEEPGGDSEIAFVADGVNFVDIAWMNRNCKVTLTTVDSGFLEVYLRRG